jgi:hypothetical protein
MLLCKLHHQDAVNQAFPNHITTECHSNVFAVKQEKGNMASGGMTKVSAFYTTPSIQDVKLWAAIGFTKVLTSCDPLNVFACAAPSMTAVSTALTDGNGVDLEDFHRTNTHDEDIALVCELGLTVDDDHEPAEENIPSTRSNFQMGPTTSLYQGQRWNWDGHCQ